MTSKSWPIARTLRSPVAAPRQLAERTPTLCRNDRPDPSRRQIDNTKIRGHPNSTGNRIRWRAFGFVEKDLSRGGAYNYSMEVISDPFESAKSHFFDTSS